MLKIAIVTGSTRPGRNNEAVANWVYRIAKEGKDAEFELVDIASFNLPLLDESMPPLFLSTPTSTQKRGQIRSRPSMPTCSSRRSTTTAPLLKNAIDYLYREWSNKAAGFVSYGGHAGGARAVEHLRVILGRGQGMRKQLKTARRGASKLDEWFSEQSPDPDPAKSRASRRAGAD
jgi:NAD(P)H-dependent FMN reductase